MMLADAMGSLLAAGESDGGNQGSKGQMVYLNNGGLHIIRNWLGCADVSYQHNTLLKSDSTSLLHKRGNNACKLLSQFWRLAMP